MPAAKISPPEDGNAVLCHGCVYRGPVWHCVPKYRFGALCGNFGSSDCRGAGYGSLRTGRCEAGVYYQRLPGADYGQAIGGTGHRSDAVKRRRGV